MTPSEGGRLDIVWFGADGVERATLAPIAAALSHRGHRVRSSDRWDDEADVSLLAIHGSQLFDVEQGWATLPSRLNVICAHDFAQAAELGPAYFAQDGWFRFDLGLVPGRTLLSQWELAARAGYAGPSLGVVEIGWPRSDRALADPTFPGQVSHLRSVLGLDDRPVVLLACSWSDRRQLADLRSAISAEVQVIARYPQTARPPRGGPWSEVLQRAYDELSATIDAARLTNDVIVPDLGIDLFELLSVSDVVVSNGSSVLYEGMLLGRPAISVVDWDHPSGPRGADRVVPPVIVPGVITGPADELPEMLRRALHPSISPYVELGRSELVPAETRGRAAVLAAETIERAWSKATEAERLSLRVAELERELERARGRRLFTRRRG